MVEKHFTLAVVNSSDKSIAEWAEVSGGSSVLGETGQKLDAVGMECPTQCWAFEVGPSVPLGVEEGINELTVELLDRPFSL